MYKVIRFFLDCYFRLSYSYEYTFKTDASIFKGPLLIAANHQTNWDPFLIHAVIPVRLAFMAKEELFKIPVLGWVMKREGAIPVKRGGSGDRQAIRDMLQALEEKQILGIFPEGTRSTDGKLQPFQPGMAMMATRSGSPVLPVWIFWDIKHKVKVHVGEPIAPPPKGSDREVQVQFTEQVRNAMLALKEEGELLDR
ncbi:MAG: 1-acyl-sn-glycerol-3-phosphate acyltransferase [Negativicutes bacterium]|nr:1-acyl-sn-glycerol-3-phosphate acyltransferase [Negativicutes bacterium]